jgi:hypothetical protein
MLVGLVSSIPLWSPGRLVRSTSTAWIRMTRRVFRRHTAPITTGSALSKPPTIQAISFAETRTFSRWANLPFGEATRTRPKGRLNCRPLLDGPGSQAARGIFHSRRNQLPRRLYQAPHLNHPPHSQPPHAILGTAYMVVLRSITATGSPAHFPPKWVRFAHSQIAAARLPNPTKQKIPTVQIVALFRSNWVCFAHSQCPALDRLHIVYVLRMLTSHVRSKLNCIRRRS